MLEGRAEGVVRCARVSPALLEAVTRRLERDGLRVTRGSAAIAMGYRDAPDPTRAMVQPHAGVLDDRVKELRLWVEDARTLRYEARLRPAVFELLLLLLFSCVIAFAWSGGHETIAVAYVVGLAVVAAAARVISVQRHRAAVREMVERAVRDALAESIT